LQGKDDWEGYARYCKNIMLNCLKIEDSNAGYRDFVEYKNFIVPLRNNCLKKGV
jgi:hypothetical protein